MAKILIVSTYPYQKTSRGIDVLTEAVEDQEHEVHHLTFPNVWYIPTKKKKFPTRVTEHKGRRVFLPYVDKLMYWFPRWLFRFWMWFHRKTVSMDFSSFDAVVLESGKPMFLLDSIPQSVPIYYRQSDSVRHALGRGKWYLNQEDRVMDRAKNILVVKKTYQEDLVPKHLVKSSIVRNGFSPPPSSPSRPKMLSSEKMNAIYFGLTPLDRETVEHLLDNSPDLEFHFLGTCFQKKAVKALSRFKNFHYYGFQPPEFYGPMIQYSDIAIIPYAKVKAVSWMGFTSKYMVYMYFGLPIVSYPTGRPGEFDPYPEVLFAKDKESFLKQVKANVNKKPKYRIDFNFYTKESIKKDFQKYFPAQDKKSEECAN